MYYCYGDKLKSSQFEILYKKIIVFGHIVVACSLSICCVDDAIYIHTLDEFFLSDNHADSATYIIDTALIKLLHIF